MLLLDYGNATLAGLPDNPLGRLQSVLNTAARLVFSARKFRTISLLLHNLHWLRTIACIRQLRHISLMNSIEWHM